VGSASLRISLNRKEAVKAFQQRGTHGIIIHGGNRGNESPTKRSSRPSVERMADISLKRISKLPLSYRKSLDHKTGWEKNANEHVACEETASWRTFSTSSAPSELLSFHRDAHMYTVGRAIASLGRYIANPIDNAMAKREFRKVLAYLKELKTAEDWVEAKQLLETKDVLSGFLEAAR
jgi:hypothetical protein